MYKRTILSMALALVLAGTSGTHAQHIMVNEAGYLPGQAKFAYFPQPDDSFFVTDKSNSQVRCSGPLVLSRANDPATGLTLYRADFSSITKEGMFQISTSSGATSIVFPISRTAFEDVYRKSLKGFYFQRCGVPLLSGNAGPYAHQICHINDAVFHSSTGKSGSALTTGGWHDAGDYGKYVVNAGVTIGTLLLGYELFPSKFAYDDVNIPESTNGVPDILDEVRFELEWLLTMQDSVDGGAYHKVTTAVFDGFEMPSQDVATRYIYQKSSTATGDLAGMMAQAARIYVSFDTAFARKCLVAAQRAWNFLQAHPTIVPVGGFHNPSQPGTGEYGDGDDRDERLWAAAELFETTGEATYRTYYESHYTEGGLINYAMGWQNLRTLAQVVYLFGNQAGASTTVKTQLRNALLSYCGSLSNVASSDGFNVALNTGDYYWGSNSVALNNAVLLICGYKLTGAQNYYVAALQQLNYVLGCNSLDMSFVTGIGARHPMYIHHRPSGSDGIAEPVPGLIAGGPNHNLTDDQTLPLYFTSATPPARCYVDNQGSWASNEICINWNAPLVFVAGFLNESPVTSVAESKPIVPARFELAQNYPNPFNASTRIKYTVGAASGQWQVASVKLLVYDLLGREVAVLVNEPKAPGTYEVSFDGSGLASGVYCYRMKDGAYVEAKTMLLLK
jgi:endoglucanase